ncbi:MAG: hypothetical protein KOO61_02000 [Spirochaetales bacterium]|nr:hypothetical protein [Spirochaetales bacterium]
MNVVTLAARMIARRRRMMLRSAIPLGFAAFVFVTAAAVITTVGREVHELERTELSGELQTRRATGPDELAGLSVKDVSSPGVLISHAWATPAIVTDSRGSRIAEIWFTDIDQELAFRRLTLSPPDERSSTGSVELTGVVISTRQSGRLLEAATPGSGLILTIPGADTISTTIAGTVNFAEQGTVIMLSWDQLPSAHGLLPTAGSEIFRLRGVEPLDTRELEHWAAETGLDPSGWVAGARRRMRDLWWLLATLIGLLYIAGGAATAPSIGIVVRRYSAEFELLSAIGYAHGYVRRLVAAIGAITATLAATAGAVVGSIVISVASARGGIDPSFLPLYWLETNPALGMLALRPSIVPVVIAVGIATGVGALSALPSARLVAAGKSRWPLWR